MSKRKLSEQQKLRIAANQQKRVSKKQTVEPNLDDYSQEQSGLVVGHYGHDVEVEALEGDKKTQIFRCKKRSNLPPLITGDLVTWCEGAQNDGVIVALHERRSVLQRPDMRGKLKPVAANIEQVFIVICNSPATPANLIDRYLVAAHTSDLTPILVLNKCDLLAGDTEYLELLAYYEQLGYQSLKYSVIDNTGIDELNAMLKDKSSIFVGQSGVGKSSMLQTLLPDVNIRIGEISDATGKGKHTTTNANLFHLPNGGDLIDSPGIREFGLWHVKKEQILACFSEFDDIAHLCKFRNCQHEHEPGCAVLEFIEQNPQCQRRFDSMKSIENTLDEVDVRLN